MKSDKKPRRAAKKTITASEARALLRYDARTGKMTWRNSRSGPAQQGAEAGYTTPSGRVRLSLLGKSYARSRLAWLMQTGEWPAPGLVVDHLDGDCTRDVWSNLRLATPAANAANRKAPKSRSGRVGVSRCKDRWRARIVHCGKVLHLGLFAKKADAVAARRFAEEQLQGEFALHNRPRRRKRTPRPNPPSLLSLSDFHRASLH